ncbi:MAG TPA: protein-glutamate O-methyltransferase CheR [Gaiellaceae bacterium]|nr:protein-glutamate O-methyltransferase CheR [Gaiellaceae bacterium]
MAIAYDDYVDFCRGVVRLTGIDLLQYKRGQMERRLRTFAERRGKTRLADYLAMLTADRDELDRFLDRVTINVSQLWRNPEQWERLGRTVVPELAQRGTIRIWSAGCSYGAECYTIAAVCLEQTKGVKVEVVGTDVDARMIERARAGLFSIDDARTVPAASLDRWFERDGAGWRAGRELKQRMTFEQGDLLSMRFPAARYDLVLCRNVVIYFTEDVRDALHARLATSLRPGGYLVVGSTERVAATAENGLELTSPFTYRKA